MKADKSGKAPEVDALLAELGNTAAAIPYYGLFQPGEEPIHFNGVFLTSESFLEQLGAQLLSEAWGKSKDVLADFDETRYPFDEPPQPERVTRLPGAAAN